MSLHVVITGASSGIGLELCKQYLMSGHKVTVICRKKTDELATTSATIVSGIDLTAIDLEKQLEGKIAGQIDILINNAGVFKNETLNNLNIATIREQFEINTLTPLRVTHALLPQLKSGSKIGIVTSRMGSIADNTSGAYYGYRLSKAAVNMVGMSLAQDLKSQKISVALLHPGYVKTKMTGFQGEIDATTSAVGLKKVMDNLNIETSGGFWHTNGERLPW